MSEIKETLRKFLNSRISVAMLVFIIMFSILIVRLCSLQIVHGASYQENFCLKAQKTLSVEAARGNIYDCKGNLLAYNELAYAITISDTSTIGNRYRKNMAVNAQLAEIFSVLEKNGETITNNFYIAENGDGTYRFTVSGTRLKRFLADVFGRKSYEDLKYNEEFDFNEAEATPKQVLKYLMYNSDHGYFNYGKNEMEEFSDHINYQIVVLRYAISMSQYTRYESTVLAENVGDATVAYISEHSDTLEGVEIKADTIRKYNYSEYFAPIIGYTGKITDEEYERLKTEDETYTMNDMVGRSGIEACYEAYLRGQNGEREVYVDTLGRITEVIKSTDPTAGSDIYLSIDAELQKATYLLLEQEIASIVYQNIRSGDIPINDVYFALVNNNAIDIMHFDDEDASATEKAVYAVFAGRRQAAIAQVEQQLSTNEPLVNDDMSDSMLDYFTSAIALLKNHGILLTSEIDTSDPAYMNWRNGKLSPKEYLLYCIANQWVDITALAVDEKYADSTEIYQALCAYLVEELEGDKSFAKNVYKYMIDDGTVSGRQLCMILYDQGVLEYDDELMNELKNSSLSASSFLLARINNIEITPAQLALDPCTGSCVITDTKTGEIKALVSYPGYDNNRLANGVDAKYYQGLNEDMSNPQYNYATQERTAPGSTFKMVTSTAGLAENVITTSTEFECTGRFMDVDNTPKCWIYPRTHDSINVSEALRDSCNFFFYTVGYRLSCKETGIYNDAEGISYIQKYAKIYGLNQKTGIEIEENTSELADEYPVMAAIGQSNNNITTIALSRYVTAVTTGNLYDYQLMSKIVDTDGNVIESYTPSSEDVSYVLNASQWAAVHSGMRMVCENLECFDDFPIEVAGKTGTAQQVETRPNHALFVGYAPYTNPEITIATRIAYGYSSHNAAAAAKNILAYYFREDTLDELLSNNAEGGAASSDNSFAD